MPESNRWDTWSSAINEHLHQGVAFLQRVFREVWEEFRAPLVFVKTKIRLALLILFGAIALLGGVGSWALNSISEQAVQMMEENYQTMAYTREMSMALTEMVQVVALQQSTSSFRRVNLRKAFDRFERYLELLREQVAEGQERELLLQVESGFAMLRGNLQALQNTRDLTPQVYIQLLNLQDLLESVYQLNEAEIKRKSAEVKAMADRVSLFMIMLGLVFFIFALLAMYYFPLYITRPVAELHHGIEQIAAKNYSERLDMPQADEFGQLARAFNEMAERLEQYEKLNYVQLLAEKRRIETLINETRDAIFGMDNEGIILFANRAALDLLGAQDENEVVGHHPSALLNRFPLTEKIFHEIIEGRPITSDMTLPGIALDQSQTELYFSKDVLVVHSENDNGKSPFGYLVVMKNVTELKKQDLAKTRFMATLSHELKTPLSAIGISLRLLQDHRVGPLNAEQEELVRTIHQNASRLLQMVNEVLDISRIETGKEAFEPAAHPPCQLARQAIAETRTLARDRKVRLTLQCDTHSEVMADARKTVAILTNLLTNAIRYSPEGDTVHVHVTRRDGEILFSVKDNGPGIAPEELPRLFQRYERRRGDRTRGTGLGLAISREFAEGQNGRIEVHSRPGEGSTFTLVLPTAAEGRGRE